MRLLFVEDHQTFAETVVREFLRDHDVTICATIKGARSAMSRGHFDALLVDYDLADGKGDEFVRRVRDRDSRIRIVAVSSHDVGNAALLDAGANEVCPKRAFAEIETVLAGLASRPAESALAEPSPRELASLVAETFQELTKNQVDELEALLGELLFGRKKAWVGFVKGIITHTELRNLLLAHADTWLDRTLARAIGVRELSLRLAPKFERLLFRESERSEGAG